MGEHLQRPVSALGLLQGEISEVSLTAIEWLTYHETSKGSLFWPKVSCRPSKRKQKFLKPSFVSREDVAKKERNEEVMIIACETTLD